MVEFVTFNWILVWPIVPSSNKRDVRSIEQTLADIRKKKQKTAEVEAIDERDLDDESYDKSPGNQTSVEGTSRTD